jgi:hypothetical protein
VRGDAVFEELEVFADAGGVEAFVRRVGEEFVDAVLALGAGGDLGTRSRWRA